MSRSFRRSAIVGHTTAQSEKSSKRGASRVNRRTVGTYLHTATDFESLAVPLARELTNVHNFPKDGKGAIDHLRFDAPQEYVRLMRK